MPDVLCENCESTVPAGRFCSNCAAPLDRLPESAVKLPPPPAAKAWAAQPPPDLWKNAAANTKPVRDFWNGLSFKTRAWTIGIALFLFFGAIANIRNNNQSPNQPSASSPSQSSSAQPSTASPSLATVSDAPMHLSEAKKALAYNYHPKGENKSWGRVDEARSHLALIPREAKEYAEVQKLLDEVTRRQAEIDAWAKVAARDVYANMLEQEYLKKGMDVDISLSGADKSTIKFKYILISRPLVYQLMNDSDFMSNLRSAGFKKVIFTDGYYHTWNIDVN